MISRSKTWALVFSTLAFVLAAAFSLPAAAETLVVGKTGARFSSVQVAIYSADPGDTVQIREGTYEENLFIDKDLTLKGAGASKVKIDGQKGGYPVLYVGPSFVEVTVKDITLQGAEMTAFQKREAAACKAFEKGLCSDGVIATGDSKLRVKQVTVSDNGATGIRLLDNARATMEKSEVKKNWWGIELYDCTRATVKDSTISRNGIYGIWLSGSTRATVVNNEIKDNEYGIKLEASAQAIIKNNKVSGNGSAGIRLEHSAQATVKNNSIQDSYAGIEVFDPGKFEGSLEGFGNRIVDNRTGFAGVSEPTQEKLVSEPKKSIPLNQLDAAPRLVRANNDFGFHLLKELTSGSPKENVFVSPVSIQLALQMTYMGAKGETKRQIAEALSLVGLTKEEIAQYSRHLLARLNGLSGEIDLSVANSIWVQKDTQFKTEFLDTNREYFEAKVEELDFSSPGAGERINGWVRKETKGKINKVVNRLTPSDMMVLINALYFRGAWKEKFEKENTKKQSFFLPIGPKELPLMKKEDRFYYLEKKGLQLIRLPYGEGRELAAYVALPRKGYGLEKLVAGLSWEEWKDWVSQMERARGLLVLPRFELRYEKTLSESLKRLGLGLAFDTQRADLSGIIDSPDQKAYFGKVNHKTLLQVDEEGTELATFPLMRTPSAEPPPEPFEMIVDHPFLFAIADQETDALIFLGGIWEPERIKGGK